MHHKVAIYDGAVVQTGTFNWTDNASCCSWENSLFIGAAEVVGQVRTLLDNFDGDALGMWRTAGRVRSAWTRSSSSRIARN